MEAGRKVIGQHYTGDKASSYDSNRIRNPKWMTETSVVENFVRQHTDINTIIDAPLGTNRYGLFLESCTHVKTVLGYELSEDMIAEARKAISSKLQIFQHDLILQPIKEKGDMSIIMRMLNLFDEENSIRILNNILNATEKYSILSLRHWLNKPKKVEGKITIQNFHVMERAMNQAGFDIIAEKMVNDKREGQYSIFTLQKS